MDGCCITAPLKDVLKYGRKRNLPKGQNFYYSCFSILSGKRDGLIQDHTDSSVVANVLASWFLGDLEKTRLKDW